MINNKVKYINFFTLSLSVLILLSCEREVSEDAVLATFPNTAEIYTDNPVGLTDEFFISFDPAAGANPEAFSTDDTEAYLGTSSIRVDVPSPDNPNGNFVGAIFRDRGEGRNLTGYDALTFWAKGSTTGTLSEVGFGTDFIDNEFEVSRAGVQLTTDWQKYIIPFPDPSKLTQERGMFLFSAGGVDVVDNIPNGNEIGWTFWLDEIRFEKLGTIAQPSPEVFNGADETRVAFIGEEILLNGLSSTYNLESGQNVSINLSHNYFNFSSSNSEVVSTDANNIQFNQFGTPFVTIEADGTAVITAELANIQAEGSLQVEVDGGFVNAPDPILPASSVQAIYSDSYDNIANLNLGAFNNQDILIDTQTFGGNEHAIYENLNFVGIGWNETIDVSGLTTIHLDVQRLSGSSSFTVELLDYGPDGVDNGFGDGTAGGSTVTSQLITNEWVSLDIPLNAFTQSTGGGGAGNPNLNNLGNIILVSNGGSFLIDNIYFY